jgi:hypothetical protein
MDPKPHQDLYLGNPAIYRMRCPHCQKLYSAERETMRAAQLPLNFHCVSCDQNFAASLNDLGGNEVVDTFEIRPEPAADPQIGGVRRAVEVAPLIEGVRCPKCGISNPRSATECVSCGVLFSKVKTQSEIEDDIVAGRRDLVEIWMKVMTNYEDLSMHERFVNACFDAENLTFASYKIWPDSFGIADGGNRERNAKANSWPRYLWSRTLDSKASGGLELARNK